MRSTIAPILLGTLLSVVESQGVSAADSDATVKRGKVLYQAHGCYACHGYNGTGRRQLTEGASGVITNDDVFLIYLRARADVKPSLPKQYMPHYPASSLPDKDALAILSYIRTFNDDPPSIDDAKALRGILQSANDDIR